MNLTWRRLSLLVAQPFRTARATRTDKETLLVSIEHEGEVGRGEAVPMDTYHQTLASAEAAAEAIRPVLAATPCDDPFHLEDITAELRRRFDRERATVAAVDAALHDWVGKRLGVPVVRLLGLNPAQAPLTSYSIGIDDPQTIERKLHAAERYPILKVKVGTDDDEGLLKLVRRLAPNKTLRVDANGGWTPTVAAGKLRLMADHGVEFVEQPIPPGDNAALARLKKMRLCPIVADESCVRFEEIVPLAGCVDGINIKLSKCGGIREALRMIHLARGLGLKVMLGCMIESSLGIAAAAQLAPLADWLDLDGHLLLKTDPFAGLGGLAGRLTIGEGPGLGVRPNTRYTVPP